MARSRTTSAGTMARARRFAVEHAEPSGIPSPYDEIPTEEVWREFATTRSDEIRNYLMEKYLHLVRYIAEKQYARLPAQVDLCDLISVGCLGLKDAIMAYELDRGVKFETFCVQRVQGAILDELRAMDPVPRLVRSRTAKVNAASQRFEKKHGRPPTDEELAGSLELQPEEYLKYKRDSNPVSTVSLNRRCWASDGSKDVREIDLVEDEGQENPFQETQRKDVRELITKGLSRAERLIVILYYYEEMTMKEIGATLDLSESRVSQMHSSILARLKAQMQHRARELEPVA